MNETPFKFNDQRDLEGGVSDKPARPVPLQAFLDDCLSKYQPLSDGEVADYIPELAKADPEDFGIAITTVDGFVHKAGDAEREFTIQSVSKAFVFALALEVCGHRKVSQTIGVEPSGEAFNSIRLSPDNRPFNPMVNAGAIACSGLIHDQIGGDSFVAIRQKLSDFAGRKLELDEAVYTSESKTGDRNRAIAWLLKNNDRLSDAVDVILDLYFKQCSLLVTAKDISVMGATLANNGINPVTQSRVVTPDTCARVLSVMASSGMYDYSGEWLYRVGLPAKSGVGGGIVAVLPTQLGLGTYSPLLDPLGNSVRGLAVYEHVSSYFGLHLFKGQADIQSYVPTTYTLAEVQSKKDRQPADRMILENQGDQARVVELAGALSFVATDYVSRLVSSSGSSGMLIFDFRRVANISSAAAKLLVEAFKSNERRIILSSLSKDKPAAQMLEREIAAADIRTIKTFSSLNDAITWAEDQIIYLYGGFGSIGKEIDLENQELFSGLDEKALEVIQEQLEFTEHAPGAAIIKEGAASDSVYFLTRGMVSVMVAGGIRVATLDAGTCFGEFALASDGEKRSADIVADTSVKCYRLSLEAFDRLKKNYPQIADTIMKNLVRLMADRLKKANRKLQIALG
jgi:glutaminase